MNEDDNKKEKGLSLSQFEIFGRFIATHGLAVFLVVYYAVALYPEAYRERSQWITEITELRNAIDPESRPITRTQAAVIFELQTKLIMEQLERRFHKPERGEERMPFTYVHAYVSDYGRDDNIEVNINNKQIKISKKRLGTEATDEYSKTSISDIAKAIEDAAKERGSFASQTLDVLDRDFVLTAGRMDVFNFGSSTLADTWIPIYQEVYSEFSKTLLEVIYYEAFTSVSGSLSAELAQYNLRIPDPDGESTMESIGEVLRNFKIGLRQKWQQRLKVQ